jgi:hypothetical protein
LGVHAYRDKKVVGVFVRFRAPLQTTAAAATTTTTTTSTPAAQIGR